MLQSAFTDLNDNGGWDLRGGGRDDSVSGFVLQAESKADGFFMGSRIKDDAATFGISNWMDDGACHRHKEESKRWAHAVYLGSLRIKSYVLEIFDSELSLRY